MISLNKKPSPFLSIELKALIVLFAFNFTTLIVRRQANFHNQAIGQNAQIVGEKMWLYVI